MISALKTKNACIKEAKLKQIAQQLGIHGLSGQLFDFLSLKVSSATWFKRFVDPFCEHYLIEINYVRDELLQHVLNT